MEVKRGADLHGLSAEIWKAATIADKLFEDLGFRLVITSGRDGKHKEGSKHYSGNALDFRSLHLPRHAKEKIFVGLKDALGPNYDVLLHGEVEHYHVEYDPK